MPHCTRRYLSSDLTRSRIFVLRVHWPNTFFTVFFFFALFFCNTDSTIVSFAWKSFCPTRCDWTTNGFHGSNSYYVRIFLPTLYTHTYIRVYVYLLLFDTCPAACTYGLPHTGGWEHFDTKFRDLPAPLLSARGYATSSWKRGRGDARGAGNETEMSLPACASIIFPAAGFWLPTLRVLLAFQTSYTIP